MSGKKDNLPHEPVMVDEVLEYLCLQPGRIILDCTVGGGGHAGKIMDRIKPDGCLIGIDKDYEMLNMTKEYLSDRGCPFKLYHADYVDADEVLRQAGIGGVQGVLLDLGASSLQFDSAERGFSFSKEGPLDMRMDRTASFMAQDLLRKISERDLQGLLKKYGEERWSKRIARRIIKERSVSGLKSTTQLARIIERAVPSMRHRIHPATRVFQALRIAVNKELESLEKFLNKIHCSMVKGARIAVISFHSLEDRIVKNSFIEMEDKNIFQIITKKPLRPGASEIERNARSRSAKLRVAERI
ncbi:MAG: 16S rRNA (cytosine(1402)-N(4))-methyltransferase [Planctomycetes bacterium RBG_16_41_13]|nr:MAG: 16S rRNA (cytosine(1402)-N(4))-methyltransferase [Planctomycetes bacterium RBG_16_41_13]